MESADVCIRGSGAVALSLALALSRQGLRVALPRVPPLPATSDVRAYALNAASVALLQDLKVWDALPESARTAVYDMQVKGDAATGTYYSADHPDYPGLLQRVRCFDDISRARASGFRPADPPAPSPTPAP